MENPFEDSPISPNLGQQNMDQASNTINELVKDNMGRLEDTEPAGRRFFKDCNLFGYDGVVVRDGQIVSLVSVDGDEDVPPISLEAEVTIEGDSRGYVSSGHKQGDKVKVIGFIEPFFSAGKRGSQSSDKIIKVEGAGVIGWIKPSEIDRKQLKEERDKEIQKLFQGKSKEEKNT